MGIDITKSILILGAGRSSTVLIEYLLKQAEKYNWLVIVADSSIQLAESKIQNHPNGKAVSFNLDNESERNHLIENSSVVISLLPPPLHYTVAKACLEFSVSLFTASYVSKEMASLHNEAIEKNILILMETGLDPGIDHMSAMKELQILQEKNAELISFESYTGGLIAPESDNNPWHYKITWNPRNVVLAGKGISKYLSEGRIEELDYKKLFSHTKIIDVENYGEFEGYPNRDSLSYLETYQLKGVKNFLRGTLRRPGFCSSWNILVNAGFTNDEKNILKPGLSFFELACMITGKKTKPELLQFLKSLGATTEDISRIEWLGCLSDNLIPLESGSPADALQILLETHLKLKAGDKDMIVMQHQFTYKIDGKKEQLTSSLVVTGEDELHTAMAKTVGLPLAIAVKLYLTDRLSLKGVQIPISQEIYQPILHELEEDFGIRFHNKVIS